MDIKEVRKENDNHDAAAISSSVRTERPGNYLFKIESFSLLLQVLVKTGCEKYDSCHFEAGGYKWKLSLYPHGDKKRGGDGYISLYLVLDEPDSLLSGTEVPVIFKFFVFDHYGDNYLVLQDGKERRFHGLKTEWGFAKLLPLEIFNDSSKGYLNDDCCAFGVEMSFHKNEWKAMSVSMMNEPATDNCTQKIKSSSTLEKTQSVASSSAALTSSSIRTERPGNFLFKIESFSLLPQVLKKTECDKYDSCSFEAGGYKWKLSIYPNGDKKRGGGGHISLFLALEDPSSLPSGWDIRVVFKFFVFDHHCDSYLVLQDGKERRFHSLKTEWGYAKLLSLELFNDPSKGYLVDDCCAFGVEMFFQKSESKGECLTIISEPANDTYTWKIDKFSTFTEDSYESDMFTIGGSKWSLLFYPKGDSEAEGGSLSLFLFLLDTSSLPSGWKIFAEYELSLKNQLSEKHHEITADNFFITTAEGCGWAEFMELTDLHDASKGFIVNDTVIIEVKFLMVSVVNNLT